LDNILDDLDDNLAGLTVKDLHATKVYTNIVALVSFISSSLFVIRRL